MGVEVTPMYIRSARNISAGGLTRWAQYDCDQWMYINGMHLVEIAELWGKLEREWEQRMRGPYSKTSQLVGPLYTLYQNVLANEDCGMAIKIVLRRPYRP